MKYVVAGFLLLSAVVTTGLFVLRSRVGPGGDVAAIDARGNAQIEREREREARIANCEAWIGMTHEQLRRSWGRPQSFNASKTADGTSYQLVYKNDPNERPSTCGPRSIPDHAFVYVEGGLVTGINTYD